jgi:hypothetical protein
MAGATGGDNLESLSIFGLMAGKAIIWVKIEQWAWSITSNRRPCIWFLKLCQLSLPKNLLTYCPTATCWRESDLAKRESAIAKQETEQLKAKLRELGIDPGECIN